MGRMFPPVFGGLRRWLPLPLLLLLWLAACQPAAPDALPTPTPGRPPTPTPYPLGPGWPRLLPLAETQAALLQGVPFLEDKAREHPAAADYARPGVLYFHLDAAPEETLLWGYLWCAADEDQLAQETAAIQLTFTFDGRPLPPAARLEETRPDAEGRPCRLTYLALTDWPTGTHHLRLTARLSRSLPPYPAGEYVLHYVVNVYR